MTYNFLLNIRLHPSLKISHDLLQFCSKYPSISIHNAPDIPLAEFLNQCSFLVASDSSILLEAALSHTPVYYYKLSDTSFKFDYYGFVSSGICIDLTVNTTEILTSIVNDGPVLTSKTALQHHSSSFGTSMEGKEGCIVASTLDEISSQQSTFSFFKLKERTFGWCIYDLSVE
jgi:spore coat polysaccharide biosynthesis predicted glycosyltransferase SpsG